MPSVTPHLNYVNSHRALVSLWSLLAFLAFLLGDSSLAQAQNPQVPQGSSATFAKTGTTSPASGSWDVVLSGSTVATSATSNGWSVSYNMSTSQFTVGAPIAAAIATGYTVRYSIFMSGASAAFDVVAPPTPTSVTFSVNPVSGGNNVTGTVTLTGNAPTGGAVVTLSKDNSIVGIPGSVTVSAGSKTANFTITTSATQTSTVANITATYNGTPKSGALTVTPPHLSALSVTPTSLTGGYGATVTIKVTLDGPSPFSGGNVVNIAFTTSMTVNGVPAMMTVPSGATTVSVTTGTTSTVNYPTTVTFTATMGSDTQIANITLNPANFRVTDVFMPNTLRLEWSNSATGNFLIYRDGTLIATLANSVHLYDDTTVSPGGEPYLYELYDSNNMPFGVGWNPLGAEKVTFTGLSATDNQTVDSRLDLRYSTNVFQDFQYGSRTYKGGLFAGYSGDPSRVGRSFVRFPQATLPSGTIYRVGNVCAYFTGANSSGGSTVSASIGAQALTNPTWDPNTVVWSTSPMVAITPDTTFKTFTYTPSAFTPVWVNWSMDAAIRAALGANTPLNVALVAQNESSAGWLYFAKKEYDSTKAPTLMYATVTPLVIKLIGPSSVSKAAGAFQVQIYVSGMGPGDHLDVTFTSSCVNCYLSPMGTTTFTVTPFNYTATLQVVSNATVGQNAVVEVRTVGGTVGIIAIPIVN